MKTSAELRAGFLDYFIEHGHTLVPSGSLVPEDDPSLLFTNAGMVQFKDVFLGNRKLGFPRATSSQCCIRAGGKHNDLENVGYTARHHTFFEMLGNFSFGDYFKRKAIYYCWDFVTNRLQLPPERLWATVHEKDDEAYDIWVKDTALSNDRISKLGDADNYWSMGNVGPCGPCTELYYDHGEDIPGAPPGQTEHDNDRFIEIWNLVFMQYRKTADGKTLPLDQPSVDTGMGLERIAAVMQGVHNNYDIDLFRRLIDAIADMANARDRNDASLKVIADHVRSCGFLIADGVIPGNEGRGYVLRRIIRRATRHGSKIGLREPFMYRLYDTLVAEMGDTYPRLAEHAGQVKQTLENEEIQFAATLEQGLAILEKGMTELPSGKMISGDFAFKLYDTYGFPVDLTADIAREKGLAVDLAGFEQCMEEQRTRAKQAHRFAAKDESAVCTDTDTAFSGYDNSEDNAVIRQLLINGQSVTHAGTDAEAVVILDKTPFYAESGGQVGDTGYLEGDGIRFRVTDTHKQGKIHKHIGVVEQGTLKVGTTLTARIDIARREAIVLNHSATHLLHAALRNTLGAHVTQKGSLVAEDRLRFDFSHNAPMTPGEIIDVENQVNACIRKNLSASIAFMPKEKALALGAMALFGEKYDDEVRVLSFGDYSVELCGGTHAQRTGDIGLFHIVAETGVSSGVRRVEAITGQHAEQHLIARENLVSHLCAELKTEPENLEERIRQLNKEKRAMEKQIADYQMQLVSGSDDLEKRIRNINGCSVLAARIDNMDRKALRSAIDRWRAKIKTGAVLLASVNDGKISLIAGVTKNCVDRINAGQLVNAVATEVGGKGGGRRPDMAEAGGKDVNALDCALKRVPDWVREHMTDS